MTDDIYDYDIPVPVIRLGRPGASKWQGFPIGASIFIAGYNKGAAYAMARRLKYSIKVIDTTENGISGCRIWRIS